MNSEEYIAELTQRLAGMSEAKFTRRSHIVKSISMKQRMMKLQFRSWVLHIGLRHN